VSDVNRLLGRLLGRSVGRLTSIDNSRLLGAVLAAGTVLALGLVAFAGFLRGAIGPLLGGFLYVFALLMPMWGIVLAALGVRLWSTDATDRPGPIRSPPPEGGVTAAEGAVGREVEQRLCDAASDHYRSSGYESTDDVRHTLREGAVRRIRTRSGHDEPTARSVVAAGEWTDDPVAAAFLSEEVSYPLGDRLRAAVDPGSAYLRRVRRTIEAIEAPSDAGTDRSEVEG
jgi:hypothetical protein